MGGSRMGSIRYEVDDKNVAWVVFDRADKLNAMTPDMMDVFAEHMTRAREDNEVSVVVMRGEGKAFCAGYDRKPYDAKDRDNARTAVPWNRLHMQGTIDFWLRHI